MAGDFNECTSDCPALRMAPGAAYISNPDAGEIVEVNTTEAKISRRLAVNGIPASFAVMGWFNYDTPLEYEAH